MARECLPILASPGTVPKTPIDSASFPIQILSTTKPTKGTASQKPENSRAKKTQAPKSQRKQPPTFTEIPKNTRRAKLLRHP